MHCVYPVPKSDPALTGWNMFVSFHVANNCSVRRFDRKGLRQVQNSFVPDDDLCGRNVVRCSYLPRESSSTQLSYMKP